MLIKSFLAFPNKGGLSLLTDYISGMANCEVVPPTSNENVLVVVMTSEDEADENRSLAKLHDASSLDHIVLVSSFNEVS